MSFSTPGRWIDRSIIGLLIVGLAGCRILSDELVVSESGRLLQLP